MAARSERRIRTSPEVRRAIQASTESIGALAQRYRLDPKTVRRWRRRGSIEDRKSGPQDPRSTVLGPHEEAVIVGIRRLTLLPLDDCFYALRAFIPSLTRASLHRCLRRHGVSRLPPRAEAARSGEFDLHLMDFGDSGAPLRLMIAVERASRFFFARLYDTTQADVAGSFVEALAQAGPVPVRAVFTDRDGPLAACADELARACATLGAAHRRVADGWASDQRAQLDRAMSLAASSRAEQFEFAEMQQRLAQFANHFNSACRLKALGGLTPQAYLGQAARPGALRSDAAPGARSRDPEGTREAILQAARGLLARRGPDGLSLSEVARLAGVNRGTAYQHFKSRKQLIAATAEWSAEQLYLAVFGGLHRRAENPGNRYDIVEVAERLATFAMHNPEICQVWLFQMLASPDPARDPFWREYYGGAERFHRTPMAQDGVDSEVLAVIQLAGAFVWPIWAHAQRRNAADLQVFARRYARECLRVSVFGVLRPECYPGIVEQLQGRPVGGLQGEPAA